MWAHLKVPDNSWYSGICVMSRPSHCLSEVRNGASLRGLLMVLADFRMLSMTGSEAVSKYIYVSERPPGNSFPQNKLFRI